MLRRGDDGWKILRQQMNHDVEMTPDMWVGDRSTIEAMPTTGGLLPRLAFTSMDLGVAGGPNAWTPDAHVDGTSWQPQVGMHELETLQLAGRLAIGIGWYELGGSGLGARWGTCTLLACSVPRGEWLVHWLVAAVSPAPSG